MSSRIIASILAKVKKGSINPIPEFQPPGLAAIKPVAVSTGKSVLQLQIPLNIQISLDTPTIGATPVIAARVTSSTEGTWDDQPTADIPTAARVGIRQPAVPLTPQQFLELVDNPTTTEADLAPYFIEDETRAHGLAPGFRINEGMVVSDPSQPALESALLLNGANGYCKMLRQRRYVQQIKDSSRPGATKRIRVVAEGDSWFEYPFMLYDVIDHLMDRPEIAVFCCSEAGDTISSMLPKGEFYVPLQRENASVFLFSGGGNDIVDGRGLRRFLEPLPAGSNPKDYFNEAYRSFMDGIRTQYETLFTRVLRQQPGIHIVCHGYSDAVPQPGKGKWLGGPMSEIGIKDFQTQQAIIKIVLNDLNLIFAGCAGRFGKSNATYVDLRGVVPANGWHDEFHPTSDYFGKVAAPIYQELLKHS